MPNERALPVVVDFSSCYGDPSATTGDVEEAIIAMQGSAKLLIIHTLKLTGSGNNEQLVEAAKSKRCNFYFIIIPAAGKVEMIKPDLGRGLNS